MSELDAMIDIETLGTKPGSIVWEIGAVSFRFGEFEVVDRHSAIIDVTDALKYGLTVDAETVAWWRGRGWIEQEKAVGMANAMDNFASWIRGVDKLWAWGMDFEAPLLSAVIESLARKVPWHGRRWRDARTVWALSKPDDEWHQGVVHRALPDAEDQLKELAEAYGILSP